MKRWRKTSVSFRSMTFWQRSRSGAQVVDTREPIDFAGAHLKGAINVGIEGKYATWAGTVLSKESPILVIADEERVSESVMRLGRIGFDHVDGVLADGMDALQGRSDLLETTNRITAAAVPELDDVQILDVRSPKEWESGHLEGSVNIPLNQLERRLDEVPRKGNLVVHCQGGYRSSIAASILQKHGLANVWDLVGGFKAWVQSGNEVVEATGSEA